MLFGRASQTFFSCYDSYTYVSTQLRAPSLHAYHICRSEDIKIMKNEQKLAITDHINTFDPRIPQNIVKSEFSLYSKKKLIQSR